MPELIEWPCDFPQCGTLVLSEDAICELCHEVRCVTHNTKEDHHCRTLGTKELRREKKVDAKRQYVRTEESQ
ncbi:hypothetical protein I203_101635 [Kwoniella mangroviensis CBS 8507]|uniref:uncharacterized protein n=1 Tax=Kwoniella mangroviensis CBS 8507 TaxID=1296122 RepID=UPI003045FF91